MRDESPEVVRSQREHIANKLVNIDDGQLEILRRLDRVEQNQAIIQAALGFIRWFVPVLISLVATIATIVTIGSR